MYRNKYPRLTIRLETRRRGEQSYEWQLSSADISIRNGRVVLRGLIGNDPAETNIFISEEPEGGATETPLNVELFANDNV